MPCPFDEPSSLSQHRSRFSRARHSAQINPIAPTAVSTPRGDRAAPARAANTPAAARDRTPVQEEARPPAAPVARTTAEKAARTMAERVERREVAPAAP